MTDSEVIALANEAGLYLAEDWTLTGGYLDAALKFARLVEAKERSRWVEVVRVWKQKAHLSAAMNRLRVQQANLSDELRRLPQDDDIDMLDLTTRTKALLVGSGVTQVHQLESMTTRDLLKISGIGLRSVREVTAVMQRFGKSMRST